MTWKATNMSHYNSDNWCGEEGYMINSKHRRRLLFLFEKAISAKVVSRGNLSILCRWHEKFSRTWERNKNRPLWKCWQSLMEEWANIQDSFESLPKLCKLWIFSSVHSTPPSATRISMLFFPRNWPSNMSYYVKGCFFSTFANYSNGGSILHKAAH